MTRTAATPSSPTAGTRRLRSPRAAPREPLRAEASWDRDRDRDRGRAAASGYRVSTVMKIAMAWQEYPNSVQVWKISWNPNHVGDGLGFLNPYTNAPTM